MIYAPYRWHASSPSPNGGVLHIEMGYQDDERKPTEKKRPRGRPRKHHEQFPKRGPK